MRRYLDQKLKLRQLRAITAIATHGNLLKASQTLSVSQPALTKTLREIEDVVGFRLFERHTRGLEPNAQGVVFIDASRRILDIVRDAEETIDRIAERTEGTVVVGALPTAAAGVLPGVMKRLHAQQPGLVIRVIEDRSDELMGALALGDIDLIVRRL